jgi:tRNA (guanine37-N1)-methyltransferase
MSAPVKDGKVEGEQSEDMGIFRPPIVRSATTALNRALFRKKVDLAAAAVQDTKLLSQYRKTLHASREILQVERIASIRPHPDKALAAQGRKCLLLDPSVKPDGQTARSFFFTL